MKDKVAIFSGRFDPPHLGHIDAILSLACEYSKVIVVILDYEKREVGYVEEVRDVLEKLFDKMLPKCARRSIQIEVNNTHFASLTLSKYRELLRRVGVNYDRAVYVSGNPEVIENMKRQGIKNRFYVHRICIGNYTYSGTKRRKELGL